MTTVGRSWRISDAVRYASNGERSADEYSAPRRPAACSNGYTWMVSLSSDTISASPPSPSPSAASRATIDSVSSSMSRCDTGHGITSSPTTTRPTPQATGGSSYAAAKVMFVPRVPSRLRDPRDLVRRPLPQQHPVLHELDLRLHADRARHGVGDARLQIGEALRPLGRVSDAQAQRVHLASRTHDLEQPRLGLVDELDRTPDVARQDRHAVDHHFVALAAERRDASVRTTARARLTRDTDEVIGPVADERRDLVHERRAHQLTALAVADGVGALRIERLGERAVLPEVAPRVLGALGGRPDVAEARLDEQLETPALDALAGAWSDRLPGEDHAVVAREDVDGVEVAGLQRVLDHHQQR